MKRILPVVAFLSVLFLALPAQALQRDTNKFSGVGVQWGPGGGDGGGGGGSSGHFDTTYNDEFNNPQPCTKYLYLFITALDGKKADSLHVDVNLDASQCQEGGFGGGVTLQLSADSFTITKDYTHATLADQDLVFPDGCGGGCGGSHEVTFEDLYWDGSGILGTYKDSGTTTEPGFKFTSRTSFTGWPQASLGGNVYVDGDQYIQPVDSESGSMGKFASSQTTFCSGTC